MTTFAAFVVVFGAIVFFHELGHFTVAKLAGIRVFQFALGFGPALVQKKFGETTYSIRALPLGGFVKLAGMDEDPDQGEQEAAEDPGSFNSKPLRWRMATIAAGPAMNFVLAAILFSFYFMAFVIPPTINMVEEGSPAHHGGLLPGDEIVTMQGQSVQSLDEVIAVIEAHGGEPLQLTVRREAETTQLEVVPAVVEGSGRLGIDIFEKPKLGFLESLSAGIVQTGVMTRELVRAIGAMVARTVEPDIAGPIGIVQIVGETARRGIFDLLLLAAVLNINLGLLNLLPIPVLDGGWLVFLAIEGIRGRPLDPKYQGIAGAVGLALLLMLMVYATFQDLLRFNWFS